MTALESLKAEYRLLDRRAADSIRNQILSGILPAGSRLLETRISEQLEVSRGTVRAALAVLTREGLVEQIAFTRWQVSETSPRDAWELYTLRAAIEGLGARLAAANVTNVDEGRLRATLAELMVAAKEKRYPDVTDIDFRLHKEIIEIAHHRRLAEQHGFLMQQVRFHMVHSGFFPKDYAALVDEHAALINAVVAKDGALAEALAKSHNEAEVKLLSAFVEQTNSHQEHLSPA